MSKNIKKTFKELQEVDIMVGALYAKDPKLTDTKFGYAYKRFSEKNYMPTVRKFQEVLTDIRSDNALTDEKTKALVKDEKNPNEYQYTKEGIKQRRREERETIDEWDKKEVEIEFPYSCKAENFPKDIQDEEIDMLKGLIINEEEYAKLMKLRETKLPKNEKVEEEVAEVAKP